MMLALWALVVTMTVSFVAFLLEDLAESPDEDVINSPSGSWRELEVR